MSDQQIPSIRIGRSQVIRFNEPLTLTAVIHQLVGSLEDLGYVRSTFEDALLEREKVFPTGLPTQPLGVAIPHTDAEHVISDAIAVGILNEPVQFEEMGTEGGTSFVDVSIITMLAISNPKQMVPLLSELATCYQDEAFLNAIYAEQDIDNVIGIIKERIPQVIVTSDKTHSIGI